MVEYVLRMPDESARALKLTPEAAGAEVLLAAAVKFFEVGWLSSGAAATLAGISRALFLTKLDRYSVPTFRLAEKELWENLTRA